MLKKLLWIILALPTAAVMIALAVANRHPVRLVLDPITPDDPLLFIPEVPFFVYLFGSLFLGLILGGVATWLGQSRWRRTARLKTREANEWRDKAKQLSRQLDLAQRPGLPSQ